MKILPDKSVYDTCDFKDGNLYIKRKEFTGFSVGTNKPSEYSWFYLLCINGQAGEQVTVLANATSDTKFHRQDGLVYYSKDRWQWHQHADPVATDHDRLAQRYTFTLPHSGQIFLSNTMLFSHQHITRYLNEHCQNKQCNYQSIGTTLAGHDIPLITYQQSKHSRGNILLTTGCHPAEPDFLASQAILNYLESPVSEQLRQNYTIHIIPLQNPDGYLNNSCLTNNGINLYWNFRKDDQANCPEAYYLWQFINQHPPLLYLDIHAYVHQKHRPPMPYLKPLSAYQGKAAKQLASQIDRALVKDSHGYFKTGLLATWPEALSRYITKEFNTIVYTKYRWH